MFPSTRRVPQQSSRTLFSGAVILLLLATGAAFASDAPARRAARLSFVSGSVSVDKSDNTSTLAGQLNMPIAEGQRVTTGDEGQAEIEFEDGSLLRLTPHTSITVSALGFDSNGNSQTQLVLLHGLTYAELRATTRFQYTIDAGGDIISPVENSTIRVNLDEPPAAIAVLDGMAHVEQSGATGGPGFHTDVKAGETLRADIADSALYFLTQQIAEDSWDQWNEARDQAAADAAAARTAARDSYAGDAGYGWSDLDANGTWYNVPGYGQVWQPGVAAGSDFDPYGYGNWVWYSGSGYLFVSGYPWGWTPYRCGNWSFWPTFGWGWVPTAGCGGLGYGGFGFAAGGSYLYNIALAPQGYRFHKLPVAVPGPVHPIVPVRSGSGGVHVGNGTDTPSHRPAGPIKIAGQTATPIHPVASAYTARGGSAIGASLHRDFPVDQVTHRPLTGTVTPPAAGTEVAPAPVYGIMRSSPVPSVQPRPSQGRPVYQTSRPVAPSPAGEFNHSIPVIRPVPVAPVVSRPNPPPSYTPRYSPPAPAPAAASHPSAPAPAPAQSSAPAAAKK